MHYEPTIPITYQDRLDPFKALEHLKLHISVLGKCLQLCYKLYLLDV